MKHCSLNYLAGSRLRAYPEIHCTLILAQNWERRTRLYIVTLLISFICRVHHAKCWTGWSTSWNQDCQDKYQQPSICRSWTNGINEEELKGLFMRMKEKSKKARLNLKLKTKTTVTSPITSWQIEGEKGKQWQIFSFLGLKIPVDGDCSCEIKRCSLEIKLWLT